MILEIDSSPIFPFEMFDSNSVSVGMTRDIPGGARIELGELTLQTRHIASAECFIPIILTFGGNVAVNLLSSWLYDKLKTKHVRGLRINGIQVEMTKDAITKVIVDSIEFRDGN